MSGSGPEAGTPLFSLVVEAGDPAAEVFLLDHQLRVIGRALGRLETRTPPGVYRAKVQLGRQVEERSILLDRDRTERVAPAGLASPAPLGGTTQAHELHSAAAERESRAVHFVHGEGASIFIFARWWTAGPARAMRPDEFVHPAGGMSLWTFGGRRVADLGRQAALGPGWDGWAALTVAVDPGPYVLRHRGAGGAMLEQVVVACRDWQTQVFLARTGGESGELPSRGGAEFANLAVLMSRSGFDARQGESRLAEVARLALADERRILSREVRELLLVKYQNPMLGLFGAHLMLLARERSAAGGGGRGRGGPSIEEEAFDEDLFAEVVGNLRGMLGPDHPDVEALSLTAAPTLRATRPFSVPPMLRRSWSLIVEASNDQPAILDRRTWRRIARFTASRPFLSWVARDARRKRAADDPLAEALAPRLALAGGTPGREGREPTAGPAEDELVPAFGLPGDPRSPRDAAMPAARMDASAAEELRRQASIELGVPRFAIDEALGRP